MQIILPEYQMLVLHSNNDIAKSIYEGRNVPAPQIIE